MTIKRVIATVLGAGLIIGGVGFLWLIPGNVSSDERPLKDPEHMRIVGVARVTSLTSGPRVRLSGITRAVQRARVAFAMPGRLIARNVKVGDTVAKGEVLARLEPDPLINAVKGARATVTQLDVQMDQADRDLTRARELAAVGVITASTEETASSAVEALIATRRAAHAQLNEARRLLGEAALKAPFSGVVSGVFAEPGEVVPAGTPIVVLSGGQGVELEIDVPENLLTSVSEGQTIKVDLPLVGLNNIDGLITAVSRVSAMPGRLFPVIVQLPDLPAIHAGLTAEVLLYAGEVHGMAVPVEAVINPSGYRAAVLRQKRGKVERVAVETGVLVDNLVQVKGALAPDDLVVVSGHAQLLDGELVEVQ